MAHRKSDTIEGNHHINVTGPKSGGEEVQLHIVYYTRLLERSALPKFSYFPMALKFVDAAFSHNCWVFYLCATPNFGKIGAQAATPLSLLTKKKLFV